MPPSGQVVASKCPFLAAEMGQKNSSVVRQVGMEFQEDVQEVRTVQKGKIYLEVNKFIVFCPLFLYIIWYYFVFALLTFFRSVPCPVEEAIFGQYHEGKWREPN